MSYTVKELAELSGVSVRTLHFYDEIELLKPAYVQENGYRSYGKDELLRLQQILFFREVGFELKAIKQILDDPSFDLIEALKHHKQVITEAISHKKILITTIDTTISHLERDSMLRDAELYYGLNSDRQKQYEKELVNTWKVNPSILNENKKKMSTISDADMQQIHQRGEKINQALANALTQKLAPESNEVQKLIQHHYDWLSTHFWTPTRESDTELGKMYCSESFRSYFEKFHPQLPEFLAEAMKEFALENL